MKNLKFWILSAALFQYASLASAELVDKNFTENRFDSTFHVNYFKTTANFGSSGTQDGLPSGYSFQVTDFDLTGRYVLLQNLGLYGGVSLASSEATDVLATRRNSTINYADIGGDYLVTQTRALGIYIDLSYRQAIEKVTTDTDSALNSDGASEVRAKVTGLFDLGYIQPYASGGFTYRTEGLSSLLTYSVGLESKFSQFVLGAALNGFSSVVDDSKTNTPLERETVTNRVDATSKKFYSINPNLMDSDIYMKYVVSPDFSFAFDGGYTVIGSNEALGFHVGAGITWGFGGSAYENYSRPTKPLPPSNNVMSRPVAPNKPTKKFQEDTTDGVNQDFFKPVTPSQDPYVDKVNDLPPASDEDEDFQVKTKKSPDTGSSDPGYQIKLKKTKKK